MRANKRDDTTSRKASKKAQNAELDAGTREIRKLQAAQEAKLPEDGKASGRERTPKLKIDEVANLLPALDAKQLEDLRQSIDAHGIKVPLLVNKAKNTIYDGRNRYLIAQKLGFTRKKIPMEVFEGTEDEIRAEVLLRNLFRRHLSEDQRVALVTMIRAPQLEAKAAERMKAPLRKGDKAPATVNSPQREDERGETAQKIAAEAKTSEHKARQALAARKEGKLGDVLAGDKTLKQAAAPAKPKRELLNGDDAEKDFDPEESKALALKLWRDLLKKFKHGEHKEAAKREVVNELLALVESVSGTVFKPVSVTYDDPNQTTHPISDVLAGRARIGKRVNAKLVASHVIKDTTNGGD